MYSKVLPPLEHKHYWVVQCRNLEDFNIAKAYFIAIGCTIDEATINKFRPVIGVNRSGSGFTDQEISSNDLDITDIVLNPMRIYEEYLCSMSAI